ncbi:MAG: dihydropteroate synthase, partial [Planctomycetes bacterium]|nr:dihydropteroate synthase [Planctomycetota bacterium]
RIWTDPGIGFGKTHGHNLSLLADLPRTRVEGCRLCVGPSRKGFLGRILDGAPASDRLEGTLACVALAAAAGAQMIRVHDVREARRAVRIACAIANAGAKAGCLS